MAIKRFCDICKKEVKTPIRVGWSSMYCQMCWLDKKNWAKIHDPKTLDN